MARPSAFVEAEGTLIQAQGTLRLSLMDPDTKGIVSCRFSSQDAAQAAAFIARRVRVAGVARYGLDGLPVEIQVDSWAPVEAGLSDLLRRCSSPYVVFGKPPFFRRAQDDPPEGDAPK